MNSYLVTWSIDIDAADIFEAAAKARDIQLNPDSIATVFEVLEHDGHGTSFTVDLSEIGENETSPL